MRSLLLILVILVPLSAAELVRDDLIGAWRLAPEAVDAEHKAQADAAAAVEGYGLTLTNRIGRAVFAADAMVAGMWRLEAATDTTATVVIQSKAGGEHRYHVTLNDGILRVREAGKVPLKRP